MYHTPVWYGTATEQPIDCIRGCILLTSARSHKKCARKTAAHADLCYVQVTRTDSCRLGMLYAGSYWCTFGFGGRTIIAKYYGHQKYFHCGNGLKRMITSTETARSQLLYSCRLPFMAGVTHQLSHAGLAWTVPG